MRHRLFLLLGLICAEVVIIALAYQFLATIECRATAAEGGCRLLRSMVARALVVFGAFVLLAWARPGPFGRLAERAALHEVGGRWAGLHLAGVLLILLPLLLAGGRDLAEMFHLAVWPWVAGLLAATLGGVLWVAPATAWRDWLREQGHAPLPVLAVAAVIPDLADLALPLWDSQGLTAATFHAVRLFLTVFGSGVFADPAAYVIGVEQFAVHIARQCSGVEGLALVTGFTALYAFLFRADIRMLRFWLVVLPVGLALSWALNVVRIGLLVLIGAHVSPQLAVDGFHSYAGWMFFTLLALGLMWWVQATPWLHRGGAVADAGAPPLRADPVAAMIVPFVVFMLAGVVTSALFDPPDVAYPVKALALALAIAVFVPLYRRLPWRPDAVALGAGLAVGVVWVLTEPPPGEASAWLAASLALVPPGWLAFWVVTRLVGTVALVPVAEEMFFRGYVMARLDRGGMAMRMLALAVSAGLFAALHGRYLEAAAAGVVFGLVMLRRGRVTDAVLCHAMANLVVGLWALWHGDFSRI